MEDWKKISIPGIAKVSRCVAEFDIHELDITPWGKYKVKIYEDVNGNFTGYTNLMIATKNGTDCGVGYGKTIEEALGKTIENFMGMISDESVKAFVFVEKFDF